MADEYTAGYMLERIRRESADDQQKGAAFERLFLKMVGGIPDFKVTDAWRWKDWPEREAKCKLGADDQGIDLVAKTKDGRLIAIQCKCKADDDRISRDDIDSFLAISGGAPFDARWIVSTCELGPNAYKIIRTSP